MSAKNLLSETPPYEVEQAVVRLGSNLRTARLRRNLTIEHVAEKIGTGSRAIRDAEKGKLTSGIAVYAALLWAYGLHGPLASIADPATDSEGLALDRFNARTRARASEGLDSDF